MDPDNYIEFDFGPEILQDSNAPTDASPDPSKVMKDGYFFVLDPDSNTLMMNEFSHLILKRYHIY